MTDDPTGVTAWFVDGPLDGWRGHVPVDPDGEPEATIRAPFGATDAPRGTTFATYVLLDETPTPDGIRRYRHDSGEGET